MIPDLKELALRYFVAFSGKDLDALAGMFTEDISLKDWEIEAKGKHNVIAANAKIFQDVKTISVSPTRIIVEGDTLAAELVIIIDETTLNILDLISYDSKGLISSIRAFKG